MDELKDAANASLLLDQQVEAKVLTLILDLLRPYQSIRNSDIVNDLQGNRIAVSHGLATAILDSLVANPEWKVAVKKAIRDSL